MQHETKNTLEITRWCNACRRMTQHQTGRSGRCLEHAAQGVDEHGCSAKQARERARREREDREPRLL